MNDKTKVNFPDIKHLNHNPVVLGANLVNGYLDGLYGKNKYFFKRQNRYKRKRFKKILMSFGIQRNEVNKLIKEYNILHPKYETQFLEEKELSCVMEKIVLNGKSSRGKVTGILNNLVVIGIDKGVDVKC